MRITTKIATGPHIFLYVRSFLNLHDLSNSSAAFLIGEHGYKRGKGTAYVVRQRQIAGYGTITPKTASSQAIASFMLLGGAFFAVLTGIVLLR